MDLLYFNNGRERTCGVAILIKRDSVQHIREVHTGEGRLLNVYAPEIDRAVIFQSLDTLLCSDPSRLVLVYIQVRAFSRRQVVLKRSQAKPH
uniref:Uncharacterized protein n=1 Tax=Salmo trutta TaxID=8032 RepID=A0A673WIE3_SALTR